ncbi:hypothetical protein [Nannocystis punicea]|uniref:Lipoprotein n=1 Tax=Nannocystis punicea TaxID=2995304 RepID=A0ABY7GT20_9BACT|nr:hypothetical protein [Nannocystis poenicansa]WAS90096.1 hypothetical protein O0S08_28210 [Nannocystis poenicansa]
MVAGCGAEGSSDTDSGGRVFRIPESVELCLVTPSTSEALFRFRGVLRLEAGEFTLPAEAEVMADAWVPFTLRTGPDGPEVRGTEGEGAVYFAADSVPGSMGFLDPKQGWETAVYVDDPKAATAHGELLIVKLAYPAGTREFLLAPVAALERDGDLQVIGFVPGSAPGESPRRAQVARCEATEVEVDRVDVTLAEGKLSFHTRPARGGGFTVLAEGEVDGVAFEIDSYWDLDYATNTVGQPYGRSPQLAVRFGEQPDGSCILLVEPDLESLEEEAYVASVLDCQQNKLRDLTVESVAVVAGGGKKRW